MLLQSFSILASQGLLVPHRDAHGEPTAGEMAEEKGNRDRELLLVPVVAPVGSSTMQTMGLEKGLSD